MIKCDNENCENCSAMMKRVCDDLRCDVDRTYVINQNIVTEYIEK